MEEAHRSWTNYLHEYEAAKKCATGTLNSRLPPDRVTAAQVLRRQLDYDPILQLYRTAELEQQAIKREEAEQRRHLARATRFHAKEEQYDIITNLSTRGEIGNRAGVARPCSRYCLRRQSEYNILAPQGSPDKQVAPRSFSQPRRQRDYDIVSNVYVKNDTDRKEKERLAEQSRAQSKLASRKYNPVLGKFLNPIEDQQMCLLENRKHEDILAKKNRREPSGVRQRPSKFYNLITHEAYDPTTLKRLDDNEHRRLARYGIRHAVDAETRAKDDSRFDALYTHFSRVLSPMRFASGASGYNIVTNEPLPKDKLTAPLKPAVYYGNAAKR